jgi:arylsulfatase A-like enzyme
VNYHDLYRNRTEIFEDGEYLTERIAREAVQFIHGHRRAPFAAYVAFNAPHYPMHAPAKYVNRFAKLSPERRMYAAMIAAVDDGVGEIRRALQDDGLLDNTIIILVGDNGATTEKRAGLNQEFATAGQNGVFRGFKFSLFDGGMHVPAMMSWPGHIPAGQKLSEQVMSMDILPTLCRATGAPVPAGAKFDGSDILDVVTAKAKSPHQALFWSQGKQLAVRRGKWKLVINGQLHDRSDEGNKPLTGEDALFLSNLEEDPGESKNLRRTNPNIVDELATLVQQWRTTLRKD